MEKPFPAERPILEILGRRWSGRAIDPERPVARETVATLLEAVRAAPSPQRAAVAIPRLRRLRRRGARAGAKLSGGRQRLGEKGAADSPVGRRRTLGQGRLPQLARAARRRARLWETAAAGDRGGSPRASRRWRWSPSAISVPRELPPKLRERERAPRQRRPLEEIAFASRWDRPFGRDVCW